MTPPSPREIMPRVTTWDTLMVAFKFTANVLSKSAGVASRNRLVWTTPALLTRQCTGPRASTAARVASQSVRSQATVSTEGHSAFRVSRLVWLSDRAITWPPQATTRSAMARPIPRSAPVTSTRLPAKEMSMTISYVVAGCQFAPPAHGRHWPSLYRRWTWNDYDTLAWRTLTAATAFGGMVCK